MHPDNGRSAVLRGLKPAGIMLVLTTSLCFSTAVRAEVKEGLWGVWHGRKGEEDIYLCIQSDPDHSIYNDFAAIYTTHDYEIELFDRGEDIFAEWSAKRNPEAIARLTTFDDGSIQLDRWRSDIWSGVTLSQITVDATDPLGLPCESMAFNGPRAIMPPIETLPQTIDGEFYDILHLADPISNAEVTTFHLPADTPGKAAINAWLWQAMPKEVAPSDYFECAKSAVESGYGYWKQRLWPELLSYHFLVVGERKEHYCGGAYPDDYTLWHVFDAMTGAEVDTRSWIRPDAYGLLGPHANDGPEIDWPRTEIEIKFRELFERAYLATAPHGNCPKLLDVVEVWNIRPTRSGLAFSPEVGGMMRGCAVDMVIAYDDLEEFIPDDVKSKLP